MAEKENGAEAQGAKLTGELWLRAEMPLEDDWRRPDPTFERVTLRFEAAELANVVASAAGAMKALQGGAVFESGRLLLPSLSWKRHNLEEHSPGKLGKDGEQVFMVVRPDGNVRFEVPDKGTPAFTAWKPFRTLVAEAQPCRAPKERSRQEPGLSR